MYDLFGRGVSLWLPCHIHLYLVDRSLQHPHTLFVLDIRQAQVTTTSNLNSEILGEIRKINHG